MKFYGYFKGKYCFGIDLVPINFFYFLLSVRLNSLFGFFFCI